MPTRILRLPVFCSMQHDLLASPTNTPPMESGSIKEPTRGRERTHRTHTRFCRAKLSDLVLTLFLPGASLAGGMAFRAQHGKSRTTKPVPGLTFSLTLLLLPFFDTLREGYSSTTGFLGSPFKYDSCVASQQYESTKGGVVDFRGERQGVAAITSEELGGPQRVLRRHGSADQEFESCKVDNGLGAFRMI